MLLSKSKTLQPNNLMNYYEYFKNSYIEIKNHLVWSVGTFHESSSRYYIISKNSNIINTLKI